MKHLILAATTLLLINGADARDRWGPPPACPQPKADCCPKPKPCPKPCPPKECKPKPCKPVCKPECPKPCDPCCPPVCFERGFSTDPCCTPAAYSEWAAIDLRCGWDVFMTANFIYWEAIQGGMDLASPAQGTITAGVLTVPAPSAVGHKILKQGFEYKPGFQLGLGWTGGMDNWVFYAEYTWLHGSTHTSEVAAAPGVATVGGRSLPQSGLWAPSSWFGIFFNDLTTSISSNWKYKIDLVDVQVSRPFYSGTQFIVEPFFGLRGAWIRQHLGLEATNLATELGGPVPSPTREGDYSSRSSAVGPRVGVNGNWHLGYGIRFIGNTAASLLFTAYDVRQNLDSPDTTGAFAFPQSAKIKDLNLLRPNLDLSLGLGWGSYFGCRRFHVDLAATYDFSVFWEQNMMRYLADITFSGTDGAPSNLYLQGLTIETRFDF